MSVSLAAAVVTAVSAPQGADKPLIAPPPAWVDAIATPAPMKESAGAALANLVNDVQVAFDAQGFTEYHEARADVQTPQGLQQLGTIPLTWSPATQTLTVHRFDLVRAGKTFDRLPKDGAFTVIRREAKLESAAQLDGFLTAVLQPEDMQVGDRLELAYSLTQHDPLLHGRSDGGVSGFDAAPLARLHIQARWPKTTPVQWRVAGGLAAPVVTERDGETRLTIEADNLLPVVRPQGAPLRYQLGRRLMLTSFVSWADVAAEMAPLYRDAMRLASGSAVAAEADAIAARTPDPAARTTQALQLVQQKVRYVALLLGEGGLRPATADQTWARRFGDCKGKTVLLLALLQRLGVEAEPVLANATFGQVVDQALPGMGAFDHVLVRAVVGGRDYWLDGTRTGDGALAGLETPDLGFVLPVHARGATLVRVRPDPAIAPLSRVVVRIDASNGLTLPAPTRIETTLRGDAARALDVQLANLTPADRERGLRAYWKQQYDFVTPTSVSAAYDAASGAERLTLDGDATLDWSGGYEADGAALGWKPDFHRDPGPDADAPLAVAYPFYAQSEETITLPQGGRGFTLVGDAAVDRELAGMALHRRATITGAIFHLEVSTRARAPEVAFARAKADAEALGALAKTTVRISAPPDGARTPAELKAATQTTPTTVAGYLQRGEALLRSQRYSAALADFDAAVRLDPKLPAALAARGLANAWMDRRAAAKADLDAAASLAPNELAIWRGRGLLAERARDWPAAKLAYGRALALIPDDLFDLQHRAYVLRSVHEYAAALNDLDAALAHGADPAAIGVERVAVYVAQKDFAHARAAATAIPLRGSFEDQGVARAQILQRAGDLEGARAEAARLLAKTPTATAYLLRASLRDKEDRPSAETDIHAALALDPKSYAATISLAHFALTAKRYGEAADLARKAEVLLPGQNDPMLVLAESLRHAGSSDGEVREVFAKLRTRAARSWSGLNGLCWSQATIGFDLDRALQDCDASLALRPDAAATLDSRAFVLLRLGRNSESVAGYDAALAENPREANSLYGRSVAERRLGRTAAADHDATEARAFSPTVDTAFAAWGVAA